MKTGDIETPYGVRIIGTVSKLRTYRDGMRIARVIFLLLKEERPFLLFGMVAMLFALSSLVLGLPVITEFIHTGLVPRFPTALLATGIMVLAFLSLASGVILDSVTHARREIRRLHYLAFPAPQLNSDGLFLGSTAEGTEGAYSEVERGPHEQASEALVGPDQA
jgi:hypothetical protein